MVYLNQPWGILRDSSWSWVEAILTLTDEEEFEALPGPANNVATVASESGGAVRDMIVIVL